MATPNKYQDLLKLVNTNAKNLGKINTGYKQTYNDYANQLVNNGSFQAIENARQNMQQSTNRQYNDAAKNYYTQYRINQNKLPEQLSNLGVTGGASETAELNLMNQYSGNLYQNESARANALNTGNMQYDQMVADNSANIAKQLASTYLSMAQQAREQNLAAEQQAYERRQAEDAKTYERQQAADAKAYERALQRAQTTGDYSVMKAFGWTAAEIKKANKLANGVSSGGGGGGSRKRSSRRRSSRRYYGYGSGGSNNYLLTVPDNNESSGKKTKKKAFVPSTTTSKYQELLGTGTKKKDTSKSKKYDWKAPNISSKKKNIKKDTASRYGRGGGHAASTIKKKKKTGSGGGTSKSRTYRVSMYK